MTPRLSWHLNFHGEDYDALQALPEIFHAWFAIAFIS